MPRLFISNSNLRNFCIFLAAFLFIFFSFILCLEMILIKAGETMPYAQVFARQQKTNEYYCPKYSDVEMDYKMLFIRKYHPDILALGSSRIMELRQGHWRADKKFYNAALSASVGDGLYGMLDSLKELKRDELPHEILLAVDLWLFNPNYPPNRERRSVSRKIKTFLKAFPLLVKSNDAYKELQKHFQCYISFINEKKDLFPYLMQWDEHQGIGFNAIMEQTGFTMDGSYVYPRDYPTVKTIDMDEWMKILKEDTYRFSPAKELDAQAIAAFKELLSFCKDNGIEMTGVMFPFRPDFYDALNSSQTSSVFFQAFRQEIPLIMKSFRFPCYDFSSPYEVELANENFFDNMHLKGHFYAQLFDRVPDRYLRHTISSR